MKKTINILLAGLLGSLNVLAAPLTPEEALTRVSGDGPAKMKSKAKAGAKLVYTSKSENGKTGAYLFNIPAGGYMILSADDVAYPVLGYSDQGEIDINSISPELKWWMDEYSRQIEWAVANNVAPVSLPVGYDESWTAISPMCTTKWNQDAPYNDQCPQLKADGPRCYAGCVAVSTAQVMKYHNYPERGEGFVTNTDKGRPSAINLGSYEIQWDKMLNVYSRGNYTEEEAAAVAYLMKAVGYSVDMNYGTTASGTTGMIIGYALRTYFNYDSNCRGEYRLPYSSSEWAKKVYENLKNVGPLIINGQSHFGGGHSFVCDGYDGKGYFHFNWGWGGYSDGFYLLDALNPDAQGIGGGLGGYNYNQDAIFGIQPPTGQPTKPFFGNILQWGRLIGSLSGRTLTFELVDYDPVGYGSSSDTALKVKMGVIIQPTDGTSGNEQIVEGTTAGGTEITIKNGTFFQNNLRPNVVLPDLGNGVYKVILASKDMNIDGSPWQPVIAPYGTDNYVLLTVNNGTYTIKNMESASFSVKSTKITTDVYQNANFMITASVTNDSDIPLTEGLAPALYSGAKQCFVGESVLATLDPNQTEEVEWVSKFYAVNNTVAPTVATKYTLKLFDPKTSTDYGTFGEIELLPSPGVATLSMRGASFPGMETTSMVVNGKTYPTVYLIDNKNSINFNFKYRVTKGYFDGQLYVSVEKMENNVPVPVIDQVYSEMPFLLASNTNEEVDITFAYPEAKAGELYRVTINYVSASKPQTLASIYFSLGQSGIEEIDMTEVAAQAEYFNLQGIKVASPSKGDLLIERKGEKSRIVKF